MGPRKVLFIQLRQLGDILLTTPCARAFKETFPETELHFLAHPMGRLILEGNPWLDRLHFYNPDSRLAELRLMRELKDLGFDLVVDFMNNPRSAIYTLATSSPRRLAYHSNRRLAYTEVLPKLTEPDYIVREKARLLKVFGVVLRSEALTLPWFESDATKALEYLSENSGFANASLRIALSPTHRRAVRRWPQVEYARLADALVNEWGAQVIWLWGPGEEEFVDDCRDLCPAKTYKMPPATFREMTAFMAQCDLFVGNSNGPSHVAVAVGTPSLQLHGPTSAVSWCPMTKEHRALQAPHRTIELPPIMSDIAYEQVWQSLIDFRPVIENSARVRVANGVRKSWQQG